MGGGVAQAAPTAIVNGDFEYAPAKGILRQGTGYSGTFAYVALSTNEYWNQYVHNNGMGYQGEGWKGWTPLPSNFSAAAFGWQSTQPRLTTIDPGINANSVEIQLDVSGNCYGEIVTYTPGTAIYQDIATTPGAIYRWTLDHASINSSVVDSMSVMIGTPSAQSISKPVVRSKSNGHDGGVATIANGVIATKATNTNNRTHSGQWATYTGTYLVPSGQTTTRFSFKSTTSGSDSTTGNLVDNISFSVAYPLYYNLNGGSSSSIPDPKANNYAGYYAANASVVLTSTKPARTGYTFMGWSATKRADATNKATYDANKSTLISRITMAAPSKTVYAVWAKNPTVTFVDGQGKTLSTQTIAPGGSAAAPAAPVRDGYTFSKWDKGYTGVHENTTVTAQWNKNPKVTFKDGITGEVVSEVEIPYGSTVPKELLPAADEHPFHDFTGYDHALADPITTDTVVVLEYVRRDEVPIKAVWKDKQDYDAIRPNELAVVLSNAEGDLGEATLSDINGSHGDEWGSSFELGTGDDVTGLSCRVPGVPTGYDATIERINSSFVITLTHVGTISFQVVKTWEDMDDYYKERPEVLKVSLTRDGAVVQELHISPNSDDMGTDTWNGTFEAVPRWDDDEQTIEYGMIEDDVYGYDLIDCALDDSTNTWNMTNRLWKHINMPETGLDEVLLLDVLGTILIVFGLIAIKRQHKNER